MVRGGKQIRILSRRLNLLELLPHSASFFYLSISVGRTYSTYVYD